MTQHNIGLTLLGVAHLGQLIKYVRLTSLLNTIDHSYMHGKVWENFSLNYSYYLGINVSPYSSWHFTLPFLFFFLIYHFTLPLTHCNLRSSSFNSLCIAFPSISSNPSIWLWFHFASSFGIIQRFTAATSTSIPCLSQMMLIYCVFSSSTFLR